MTYMNNEIIKKFIVIEGLDGSGTTTQLHYIAERCKQASLQVMTTFEPTDNEIGKLIRRVLALEIEVHPSTLAHLYVADRHEHLYGTKGIVEMIQNGSIVISDRYLFSSLAYQSVTCGFELIRHLNGSFPLPELVIFIDLDPDISQSRISKRSKKELFDSRQFQEQVRKAYLQAFSLYDKSEMTIEILDGHESPETIHEKIWDIFLQMSIMKL